MTLQAFCGYKCVSSLEMDQRSGWTREETHELTPFGTFLDVCNELLLALLEFCALAVEFALCLCQGALMLAQTLRWSHCATKERFLRSIVACYKARE